MSTAYNTTWLKNIDIVKEVKTWSKQNIISRDQFKTIADGYPSSFYHPNLMIRILLFIASIIGIAGITGIFVLIFADAIDSSTSGSALAIFYGLISFVVLDRLVIGKNNHYKSGVTEAILYHSMLFTLLGIAGFSEFENVHTITIACVLVFSFAAYRYLDLISTACAMAAFSFLIFYELYQIGGIFQQIIPLVFIGLFTPLYFILRKIRSSNTYRIWNHCLILLESLCLILIYAAGNYFVVRELSIGLMDLQLNEGQDIPFAFLFYGLTVLIPTLYLYIGIKTKNIILLRVSLLAIAFSVFTFKYYFSMGHPEFTLTAAGTILLGVTLSIFRYLRTPKYGYTRENILQEKWASMNAEGFIISQTMGGNTVSTENTSGGGGGSFSGGGSTDSF